MNFLIPNRHTPIPSFYNGSLPQMTPNMTALYSYLQLELTNTQNALKAAQDENASLKDIIVDLQKQLANKNQQAEKLISKLGQSVKEADDKIKKSLKLSKTNSFSSPIIKVEESQSTEVCETSIKEDSAFASPYENLKLEDENDSEEERSSNTLPIRRRNGFKPLKDAESESQENKGQRSRAKHLWITYGRKIIDYATENSTGLLNERIRACNKLISKKGYSETFLLRHNDPKQEKTFKIAFGNLALDFLECEVENAFLSSNYREELLAQKTRVKTWIKKLIKQI